MADDVLARPAQVEVRPAGEKPARAPDVAYALLIGYALLMLIPFAWQVITSFKTDRDALRSRSSRTRSRSRAGRPAS